MPMLRLILALLVLAAAPAWAQSPRPLLVEGKTTVYQRVLTRPGAAEHLAPDGARVRALPPFQPLYVYARQGDWAQTGVSATRGATGWVRAAEVVPWKQNIVAAFTNPAGRQRTLFFRDRAALETLLADEALATLAARYGAAAAAGTPTAESGVISIEPAEHVDIAAKLYLLPILDFVEDFHPQTAEPFLKLHVASLPLASGATSVPAPQGPFEAGVVFVIDTTRSMDPYIAETRAAVAEIIAQIRATDVGARVHFGVLGFRDDPSFAPGIDYRVKEFVPLQRRDDPAPVLDGLGAMRAATVSTAAFNEDSLAAVEQAIEKSDWDQIGKPFGGKYVVLVTDAGPKRPGDPRALSNIAAGDLQARAAARGIALMTLHLKTPDGVADHDYAAAQYQALSRFNDRSYYYPIPDGSRAAFGAQVRAFVQAFADHVRAGAGQAPQGPVDDGLADLGLAMRLAYLGAQRGAQAPAVIDSWVSDKALEDPRRVALEPRLLITKNELSTLKTLLQTVLDIAERDQAGDQDRFFAQIKDAMARMAQNPDTLVNTGFDTLGGAFGEILTDLPYTSPVMEITEQRWANSGTLQREVLETLRSKFLLYEKWHDDPANWTALAEGAPDGERVFAMPFSVLP